MRSLSGSSPSAWTRLLLRSTLVAISLVMGVGTARAKPSKDEGDDGERIHVVSKGQTLGAIARRYHVSIQELRESNDLVVGQKIKPGQRLTIPSRDEERERSDDAGGSRRHKDSSSKVAQGTKHFGEQAENDEDRDSPHGAHRRAKNRQEVKDDREEESRETRSERRGHPTKEEKHKVHLSFMGRSWDGVVQDKHGHVTSEARHEFEKLLRFPSSGEEHEIEPRLIKLVAQVSEHFGGRQIEVVSGFRPKTPTQYTPHSKHNLGHAMDFHVDGVSNEDLRDYCKGFRDVGVGYYPNSSFVHLDVRPTSATWVDLAGPGEPPRYVGGKNHDEEEAAQEVTTTVGPSVGKHGSEMNAPSKGAALNEASSSMGQEPAPSAQAKPAGSSSGI